MIRVLAGLPIIGIGLGMSIALVTSGMINSGKSYLTDGCGLRLTAQNYAQAGRLAATAFFVGNHEVLVYIYDPEAGAARSIYAADRSGKIQYAWHDARTELDPRRICEIVNPKKKAEEHSLPRHSLSLNP